MESNIDILILNRNMKAVTDQLVSNLKKLKNVGFCGVIDSGSKESEVSKFTFIRDDSSDVIKNGLRPNRGFHLGLVNWLARESQSEWVLLLPNDSEVVNWKVESLISMIQNNQPVVAAIPIAPGNPYSEMFPKERVAIGWNFHEGPLLLKKQFVADRLANQGYVLDPSNFRGYLSFIELALQIYSNNLAIVATDLISFRENQSHILHNYQLIGTEPWEKNLELLVTEGEKWLAAKHGVMDRWSFEMITRLVFEEFIRVNPNFPFPALV